MLDNTFEFIRQVYRTFRSVYLFFAIIFFFIAFLPASALYAGEGSDYRSVLVVAARQKRLSEERTWRILLHYEQSGSRLESLVDDPNFFLAPNGKRSPDAELEATLAGFFQPVLPDEEHPQCRFIARYHWLKEQLSIDDKQLVPVPCPKWEEASANMDPHSAVLVFPAAHGNGPSSMFGHTLVRIDSAAKNDLLSYAVNYAAYTETSGGFGYAMKGIFGFFKGYFSVLPYYEKVTEYNHIDHRDIWEYKLDFSPPEVRRMVMHMWELKDVYSDYYFFDENCSYDLLYLLESARPSLELTSRFRGTLKFWVIPTDTVRVIQESGIIKEVVYRPSQATRIVYLASRMKTVEQDLTLDILSGKATPRDILNAGLSAGEAARVLDLSAELVQYRFSKKELEKVEYQKQFLSILNARSTLGAATAEHAGVPIPSVAPDQGHFPEKIDIGIGYRSQDRNDSWFTEISWRPAYHDLMDPDDGYVEGAQINFFDLRGRYYFRESKVRLQSLRLIDIFSLAARDKFFHPVSWKVNTGVEQELLSDGKEHLVSRVNGGGGVAYPNRILGIWYAMLNADLNVSGAMKKNYALGMGPSAGILKKIIPGWKLMVTLESLFYELGDTHARHRGTIAQSVRLNTNNTVSLSFRREKSFHHYLSETNLSWNYFF